MNRRTFRRLPINRDRQQPQPEFVRRRTEEKKQLTGPLTVDVSKNRSKLENFAYRSRQCDRIRRTDWSATFLPGAATTAAAAARNQLFYNTCDRYVEASLVHQSATGAAAREAAASDGGQCCPKKIYGRPLRRSHMSDGGSERRTDLSETPLAWRVVLVWQPASGEAVTAARVRPWFARGSRCPQTCVTSYSHRCAAYRRVPCEDRFQSQGTSVHGVCTVSVPSAAAAATAAAAAVAAVAVCISWRPPTVIDFRHERTTMRSERRRANDDGDNDDDWQSSRGSCHPDRETAAEAEGLTSTRRPSCGDAQEENRRRSTYAGVYRKKE